MSDLTHYKKAVAERIRLVAEYDPPDMAGVASLLDLTLRDAADFVAAHAAAIDATAQRMAIKGNLLEPKARKLAQKLLDRMLTDVDSLDPLEAADLIKHPLRIIENADRVRQAQKADPYANLPVFNFIIHRDGISAELAEPANVVDVPTKHVNGKEGADA
jgi:hypothetical protein